MSAGTSSSTPAAEASSLSLEDDFLSQAQAFFDTISPENLRRDAARAIRAGHIECMTSDTDFFVDTNGLKRVDEGAPGGFYPQGSSSTCQTSAGALMLQVLARCGVLDHALIVANLKAHRLQEGLRDLSDAVFLPDAAARKTELMRLVAEIQREKSGFLDFREAVIKCGVVPLQRELPDALLRPKKFKDRMGVELVKTVSRLLYAAGATEATTTVAAVTAASSSSAATLDLATGGANAAAEQTEEERRRATKEAAHQEFIRLLPVIYGFYGMMPSQVSTVLRGETFVGSPVEFYEALGVDLTEFEYIFNNPTVSVPPNKLKRHPMSGHPALAVRTPEELVAICNCALKKGDPPYVVLDPDYSTDLHRGVMALGLDDLEEVFPRISNGQDFSRDRAVQLNVLAGKHAMVVLGGEDADEPTWWWAQNSYRSLAHHCKVDTKWFCVAGFAVVARRSVLKAAGYADVPRPSKAAPKKTAPPKKTPAKISATSNQTTDSPKGTKEKRRGLTPPDKQAKKAKEDGNEQKESPKTKKSPRKKSGGNKK